MLYFIFCHVYLRGEINVYITNSQRAVRGKVHVFWRGSLKASVINDVFLNRCHTYAETVCATNCCAWPTLRFSYRIWELFTDLREIRQEKVPLTFHTSTLLYRRTQDFTMEEVHGVGAGPEGTEVL